MAVLITRRRNLAFQGLTLDYGEEIDQANFPAVPRMKWAQLIDQGYFDVAPTEGAGPHPCDMEGCEYVGVSAHALSVHIGRAHKRAHDKES